MMDGVAMEIDNAECVVVSGAPMLRLVSCVYADGDTDDQLIEMLRQEYTEVGYLLFGGPQEEQAFVLLKDYSQLFVKLIAIGMCDSTTHQESLGLLDGRGKRAIIHIPLLDYNTLINGYDEAISKFGLTTKI